MKRLWLIVAAVLVPFGALVFFGLRALDDAPKPPPVAVPTTVAAGPAAIGDGAAARDGVARALAPPAAPGTAAVPAVAPLPTVAAREVGASPPHAAGPVGTLEPSPLDAQAAELANRGRVLGAPGKDLVLPPNARNRAALKPTEQWNKNGFPPKAAAGAAQASAHCWADNKGRLGGANPTAQVIVLARPTAEGKFEQATVRWSSWNDPIFMACVEDALELGSFPPGDPLPPAPVLHTLEFGAAP